MLHRLLPLIATLIHPLVAITVEDAVGSARSYSNIVAISVHDRLACVSTSSAGATLLSLSASNTFGGSTFTYSPASGSSRPTRCELVSDGSSTWALVAFGAAGSSLAVYDVTDLQRKENDPSVDFTMTNRQITTASSETKYLTEALVVDRFHRLVYLMQSAGSSEGAVKRYNLTELISRGESVTTVTHRDETTYTGFSVRPVTANGVHLFQDWLIATDTSGSNGIYRMNIASSPMGSMQLVTSALTGQRCVMAWDSKTLITGSASQNVAVINWLTGDELTRIEVTQARQFFRINTYLFIVTADGKYQEYDMSTVSNPKLMNDKSYTGVTDVQSWWFVSETTVAIAENARVGFWSLTLSDAEKRDTSFVPSASAFLQSSIRAVAMKTNAQVIPNAVTSDTNTIFIDVNTTVIRNSMSANLTFSKTYFTITNRTELPLWWIVECKTTATAWRILGTTTSSRCVIQYDTAISNGVRIRIVDASNACPGNTVNLRVGVFDDTGGKVNYVIPMNCQTPGLAESEIIYAIIGSTIGVLALMGVFALGIRMRLMADGQAGISANSLNKGYSNDQLADPNKSSPYLLGNQANPFPMQAFPGADPMGQAPYTSGMEPFTQAPHQISNLSDQYPLPSVTSPLSANVSPRGTNLSKSSQTPLQGIGNYASSSMYQGQQPSYVQGTAGSEFGEYSSTAIADQKPLAVPGFLLLERNEMVLGKQIGKGGSATLYMGHLTKTDTRPKTEVAIKVLKDVPDKKRDRQKIVFQQELAIMNHFKDHPNVVKLMGFTWDPLTIVMKIYKDGSMAKFMVKKLDTSLEKWLKQYAYGFAKDILSALKELHMSKITHNDLKPANILVDKIDNKYVAILCDFSIATIQGKELLGVKEFRAAKVRGASLPYASPEVMKRLYAEQKAAKEGRGDDDAPFKEKDRDNEPLAKSDVYSFSITMFEIMVRGRAWPMSWDQKKIIKGVIEGLRPEFPKNVVKVGQKDAAIGRLISIIEAGWRQAPAMRPSAAEQLKQLPIY